METPPLVAAALFKNTSGFGNTANGSFALANNTTGINNTAVGREALLLNTTGESNVGIGRGALGNNTTGDSNLALGIDAGNQVSRRSADPTSRMGPAGWRVPDV